VLSFLKGEAIAAQTWEELERLLKVHDRTAGSLVPVDVTTGRQRAWRMLTGGVPTEGGTAADNAYQMIQEMST